AKVAWDVPRTFPRSRRAHRVSAMASSARMLDVPGPDGDRQVRISSPEREMWPEMTKWDLASYTAAVGPALLRAPGDRSVTLQRSPAGVDRAELCSRNPLRGAPEWSRTVMCTYPSGRKHPQLVIDEAATAVRAVQMNTITFPP